MDYIVTPGSRDDKIDIRWTDRIPGKHIDKIARDLDSRNGVERVYPHRYSIEVFFAPHVIKLETLMEEVNKTMAYWATQST